MAIREREVGRIDGSRMPFVLYSHPHIRQREVCVCRLRDGNVLKRIALMSIFHRVQGFLQTHIGIQRIVLRAVLILRHRVIERRTHLRLVGEELTEFNIRRDGVRFQVFVRPLRDSFLKTSESFAYITSLDIQHAQV